MAMLNSTTFSKINRAELCKPLKIVDPTYKMCIILQNSADRYTSHFVYNRPGPDLYVMICFQIAPTEGVVCY